MEETKKWWQSKTVIASLVTAVLGIAAGFGWVNSDSTAEAGVVADNVSGIVVAVMSLIAIFGRVTAKKQVK